MFRPLSIQTLNSRKRLVALLALVCLAVVVPACGPLGSQPPPEPTFTPHARATDLPAQSSGGPDLDATVTAIVASVDSARVSSGPQVSGRDDHHPISPLIYGWPTPASGDQRSADLAGRHAGALGRQRAHPATTGNQRL